MAEHAVKVVVRVRPLLEHEVARGASQTMDVNESSGSVSGKEKPFEFGAGHVICGEGRHDELYKATTKQLIGHLFEGYNATVLAYGQTGSGKTYSMGTLASGSDGIVPRAVAEILERKEQLEASSQVVIHCSLMEVYNEEVRDLLSADTSKLAVRDGAGRNQVVVCGLTEHLVNSSDEVFELMRRGMQTRATAATDMNTHSSRSHMISTFRVEVKRGDELKTVAKLHLVDLAGSERAKRTGATGDRLKEGIGINKSLLALGQVIARLVQIQEENKKGDRHVPYRDSTLTRVLADSLGGSAIAVMIACVSPNADDAEESANTLRWASRALKIRNVAVTNIEIDDRAERRQLAELRQRNAALEAENRDLRNRVNALRFALTPEAAAVAEGVADDALVAQQHEQRDDDDDEDNAESEDASSDEEEAERKLASLRMEGVCMEKLRDHYEKAIAKLEFEVTELEKEREKLILQSTTSERVPRGEADQRVLRERARELEKKATKLRAQAIKATEEAKRCAEMKARAESEATRLRADLQEARRRRGILQRELQSRDAQHATAVKEWRREAKRLRRDRDRLSGEKKRLAEHYQLQERTRLRQLAESRAAVRRLKKQHHTTKGGGSSAPPVSVEDEDDDSSLPDWLERAVHNAQDPSRQDLAVYVDDDARPLVRNLARYAAQQRAQTKQLQARLDAAKVAEAAAATPPLPPPPPPAAAATIPTASDHQKVIDEYAARCQRIRRQSSTAAAASVDVDDLAARMKAVKNVVADVRNQREAARSSLPAPLQAGELPPDPKLLRDVVPRNYSKPWQHNAHLVPRQPAGGNSEPSELPPPPAAAAATTDTETKASSATSRAPLAELADLY